MQKLTRDRRELWGVSQGCFNPLRVRLTLLSEPDPSPPIHPCGCLRLRPQSLLHERRQSSAKAITSFFASWAGYRSSPPP